SWRRPTRPPATSSPSSATAARSPPPSIALPDQHNLRRRSVAEAVEGVGAALPVALDLDLGVEVHPRAEERLELLAGLGAGGLDQRAALTDDHALLRLALDEHPHL